MKKKKYRSNIAGAMHETISGMHRLGLVDKKTMRDFDMRCLTSIEELTSADIQALRKKAAVSQAVLAHALNVTTNYISKLENGTKQASGSTLKLLSLMKRHGFEAII